MKSYKSRRGGSLDRRPVLPEEILTRRAALVPALTMGVVALGALLGCTTTSERRDVPMAEADGTITQAEIDRAVATGARTVADLLPRHSRLRFRRAGRDPASLEVRRGARRDPRAPRPLVVIDGAPVSGLRWLEETRLEDVIEVRLLSRREGVTLFGNRAAGGAILVRTRPGLTGQS